MHVDDRHDTEKKKARTSEVPATKKRALCRLVVCVPRPRPGPGDAKGIFGEEEDFRFGQREKVVQQLCHSRREGFKICLTRRRGGEDEKTHL